MDPLAVSTKYHDSIGDAFFQGLRGPLDHEFTTCDFCVYCNLSINDLGDSILYTRALVQGANWSMTLLLVNVEESLLSW